MKHVPRLLKYISPNSHYLELIDIFIRLKFTEDPSNEKFNDVSGLSSRV